MLSNTSLTAVNSIVAETHAKAPAVIPVKPVLDLIGERESILLGKAWIPFFTGMTGDLKRLSPENRDSRVKILARKESTNYANQFIQHKG